MKRSIGNRGRAPSTEAAGLVELGTSCLHRDESVPHSKRLRGFACLGTWKLGFGFRRDLAASVPMAHGPQDKWEWTAGSGRMLEDWWGRLARLSVGPLVASVWALLPPRQGTVGLSSPLPSPSSDLAGQSFLTVGSNREGRVFISVIRLGDSESWSLWPSVGGKRSRIKGGVGQREAWPKPCTPSL